MYLHGNLDFSEELFMQSLQKAPRNAHNLCGASIVLMEKGAHYYPRHYYCGMIESRARSLALCCMYCIILR